MKNCCRINGNPFTAPIKTSAIVSGRQGVVYRSLTVHRGKPKRLTAKEKKQLKRRQAIEPIIGHLKTDHGMDRCYLKGEQGDRLHAVLCAAGYNIKWLLRMIARKGVRYLHRLFLRLLWVRNAVLGPVPLSWRSV